LIAHLDSVAVTDNGVAYTYIGRFSKEAFSEGAVKLNVKRGEQGLSVAVIKALKPEITRMRATIMSSGSGWEDLGDDKWEPDFMFEDVEEAYKEQDVLDALEILSGVGVAAPGTYAYEQPIKSRVQKEKSLFRIS